MCSSNRLGDATASGDVVFLDQEGVVQTDAVVVAATAGNGILLRQAQPGYGLARIEQTHAGPVDHVRVVTTASRHTRQQLQKIQRTALAGEQRPRRPREMEQHPVSPDTVAIGNLPVNRNAWVDLAEYGV